MKVIGSVDEGYRMTYETKGKFIFRLLMDQLKRPQFVSSGEDRLS